MRMRFLLMLALGMGCAGPAAVEEPTTESACQSTYVACGCGCCGGVSAREESCLTCDGGKALQEIIDADKQRARDPQCALAGCSFPVRYSYCATAP